MLGSGGGQAAHSTEQRKWQGAKGSGELRSVRSTERRRPQEAKGELIGHVCNLWGAQGAWRMV